VSSTHRRWTSWYARKVFFLLADDEHKITIVPHTMKLRIRKAEHDRNVYEGDIDAAWEQLPREQRNLEFVGVLYADCARDFLGQINWVEDSRVK